MHNRKTKSNIRNNSSFITFSSLFLEHPYQVINIENTSHNSNKHFLNTCLGRKQDLPQGKFT